MDKIEIYTDGSCSPNPGEGGWGVVLICHRDGVERIKTLSGYCPLFSPLSDEDLLCWSDKAKKKPFTHYSLADGWFIETTNNRMELESIIQGLSALKKPSQCEVVIYSDSKWAINALQGTWNVKENLDLVTRGKTLLSSVHSCEFVWVKGHANNKWNEKANDIAMKAVSEKHGEEKVC